MKSPTPEITPTRLRQHISMTSGASPSILGMQRSRKPSPPLEVPAGAPSVAAQEEPVPDEKPHDVPAIIVDTASVNAPMHIPLHAYWEQRSLRHSPQLDSYQHYVGMPSYPRGDGPPPHRHFQAHDPYYSRAASPFLRNAGLAPPPQPFMRSQSPSGPYMIPQQSEGGQRRADFGFPELDMSSDWVTLGYSDKGSGDLESRLQSPLLPSAPLPPLPPKPIELTSTSVPPSTELPRLTNRQSSSPPKSIDPPRPATPNPSAMTKDTLSLFYNHRQSPPPRSEAPEPPALSSPDEMAEPPEPPESPQHILQDELHKPPVVSPKPTRTVGGRPTTKALGLIEEGFNKITEIIEGLAEVTGKAASDLYRRLEKSRKGVSEGHLWNIYLHYFARHEEQEAARLNKPLERTQTFRSQCYAKYKVDNANFHELLETYQELEMAGTEMTVGQRKREVEKYEKKLRDMVSLTTLSCSNSC
jgi:hypothetical protein